MKKMLAAAGVVVFVLAGCGTNSATPVATVTVSQSVPQVQDDDSLYVQAVRSKGNVYIDQLSDSEIVKLGTQVCPILDSGISVKELATKLTEGLVKDGITDPEAYKGLGTIVGAAIHIYCPQYDSQVQSL